MNLYLKYGPLAYTWNTRISHEGEKSLGIGQTFFNLISYVYMNMGIGLIGLIYLYIGNVISLNNLIFSCIGYIGLYLLFLNFYEIGYLHNSIVAKKEKNPTIRIYEKLPKNFYLIQIIIRIIIGLIFIITLFSFNKNLGIEFVLILLITQIIFLIHNIIRNYFYNFITILLLRILKFSPIYLILSYFLGFIDNVYMMYFIILFLLYLLFDISFSYNKKMGGENKLGTNLLYIFLFISCAVLFFITMNHIFIFFGIIYLILFFLLTPKAMFIPKNDR